MFARGPMPGSTPKADALKVLPAGATCQRVTRMGITGYVVSLKDGRQVGSGGSSARAWEDARAWGERRAREQENVDKGLDDEIQAEIAAMLRQRKDTMQEFTPGHRDMVIYAVMRKDLEMPAGKLASQTGHAYAEAVENTDKELLARYKGTGHGIKLAMTGKNYGQVVRAYGEAKKAGMPCYLIFDRSHVLLPHFTGEPLLTGIAIGPVYKDEAQFITKRLTAVK